MVGGPVQAGFIDGWWAAVGHPSHPFFGCLNGTTESARDSASVRCKLLGRQLFWGTGSSDDQHTYYQQQQPPRQGRVGIDPGP